MRNDKLNFAEKFIHLDRAPIRFKDRPYLPDVYSSDARNLVIRASRQVEKSTFLVNTILHEACTNPGVKILFVCPRIEQACLFSSSRVLPAIEQSPLVRRRLLGRSRQRPPVMNMQFANDSQLYIRAAYHTADAVRGISADLLFVDEFQDIAAGDLPVLQECLSHAPHGRTILTGTPKLIDNHLEAMFAQSTANEWTIDCPECGHGVILDERCLGPTGIICPNCQCPLDAATGRWVPRNPAASWGDGFWVNHLMVPWMNYDKILDCQRTYDLALFKNEVLGLPTSLGEHIVTRAELEACCADREMARSAGDLPEWASRQVVVGIDWGGGGVARTVVAVGYMRSDYAFEICHFSRFRPDEDPNGLLDAVAGICRAFQARWIAADGGGNGQHLNRLLLDRLRLPPESHLHAILYSASDQPPRKMEISGNGPSTERRPSECYSAASGSKPSCFHAYKIAARSSTNSPAKLPNTTTLTGRSATRTPIRSKMMPCTPAIMHSCWASNSSRPTTLSRWSENRKDPDGEDLAGPPWLAQRGFLTIQRTHMSPLFWTAIKPSSIWLRVDPACRAIPTRHKRCTSPV